MLELSQLGTWSQRLDLPRFAPLFQRVEDAYGSAEVYPLRDQLFTAFSLTPPEQVRVVILGQDPYHEPGQATDWPFPSGKGLRCRRLW